MSVSPVTRSYPVEVVLDGCRVLVVGGGAVALRKVEGLVGAGAVVDVVAPRVVPELRSARGVASIARRPYRRGEVAGYRLAVTATDDPAVNRAVFDDGEVAGVWVNAADDPTSCSVTLPSVSRTGGVTVAVSTGGRSPALARWFRQRVAAWLEPAGSAARRAA